MPRYEPIVTVEKTQSQHVSALGANLRARDISLASRMGLPAHRALWRAYKKSLICKTVFADGEVAAIFGINGDILGKVGNPWFIASPLVEEYPFKLAFRYKSELRNMLMLFPVLEDWVIADDEKTLRLLGILGFEFADPEPLGDSKIMFIKATLRGQ